MKNIQILMKPLTEAIKLQTEGKAISIGVLCNAVHLLERLIERNIIPDTLTDQTSAHDPLIGYWPHHDLPMNRQKYLREKNPEQYIELCLSTP